MPTENHKEIQQLIDKRLSKKISREEETVLLEHLRACAECQEYKAKTERVVTALEGFTFEASPELNAKVHRAMEQLVRRLAAAEQERRSIRWASLAAFLLSFLGSSVVWELSDFLEARLRIPENTAEVGVLLLWVAPSLLIAMLLPIISGFLVRREAEKGWRS